ncbi:MAG TPA: fluoride efflux transporter CrcB [Desulfobacteraceae bacterium]|nr:fluoride efflux transporter CrcB [Deltaproteobacteria bacterium]MBW2356703.1 fluoride efflux transporter CrcB [Deltaproteobacteria bacterium]RLB93105.1 MAG: fluoride efflux transporter CrcB [Deltaproteobacteria bacterium]HDI60947.1 fluoride efflux transporter CrcB [Desulfobacteraceae bacterium]
MEAWAQPLAETWRLVQPGFNKVLLVMVGGGLGAVSRYGIGLLSARLWGPHFPWGTLTVNLVGCFLIGLLFAFVDRARFLTPDLRLLLVTGYLGALTTFSTFALETINAGRFGLTLQPLANILVNNIGGLALVVIGMRVGGLR